MSGVARLFSALVPPEHVLRSLRAELARHSEGPSEGLRWSAEKGRHVTLGFYGTDDLASRAGWLRARLAGLGAPVLRLEGGGTFRGVLWAGVRGSGLAALAEAARPGGDDHPFHAHLTLARGSRHPALTAWARLLSDYRSPEWIAGEVTLLRSDPGRGGHTYTTVERFALGRPVDGEPS
ncbi:2'-5' RNA ligase family protein [Prauserella cavernicola]|uniref:RNA 2',3'-cyclic phosphodiesterase n=1 Tax=Prauserella cavernicola TaxID=2800127 RepID=A0A934QYQ8_9PSEU|nr:RNA 2',3'-cyclic phosphodiesterase [Prauserella cavernicola]MBK1788582.1 RNA 2',3'-cyclic phosphodiesterase [Prauserella cavernicola]